MVPKLNEIRFEIKYSMLEKVTKTKKTKKSIIIPKPPEIQYLRNCLDLPIILKFMFLFHSRVCINVEQSKFMLILYYDFCNVNKHRIPHL
jgi:hypothetical protein